ncbi:hypothetical protein SDRG_16005 [Saprolegnia diclina VS20]|uniref:Uncharacterized protein n=1 Tax=Saprolegnia diclina (strain VS20) TaxID=1156394 RepID=T0R2A4_SAPDV|nr:hypothetical protein SDRG_16005 [Saprolegnia diclina VS20]EQC26153.1 hypothetical protein SDRG_16005 [Saprolegnia diclina VS20]|eukprot:XP_008620416.1 hypothetical protein SDRG_16005 [Saprolegnia diclina VS20]
MRNILSTLCCLAATVAADTPQLRGLQLEGGYNDEPVDNGMITTYFDVMTSRASYAKPRLDYLCTTEISAVSVQVVAGLNTRYHVAGCTSKSDKGLADRSCTCSTALNFYVVTIFTPLKGDPTLQTITRDTRRVPLEGAPSYGHVVTDADAAVYYDAVTAAVNYQNNDFPVLCARDLTSYDAYDYPSDTFHVTACEVEYFNAIEDATGPNCGGCSEGSTKNYAVTVSVGDSTITSIRIE